MMVCVPGTVFTVASLTAVISTLMLPREMFPPPPSPTFPLYVTEIEIRSASTPMKEGTKLNNNEAEPEYMLQKDYRGLVGSLLYLTMVTRPDICFAVKELSRMLDTPGQQAWEAAQHLLEYVHNTPHYSIRYTRPENTDQLTVTGLLQGYSDADWAGQVDDRRSTSGYVFFMAGGPVSWQSKTQKSVALSTAEA